VFDWACPVPLTTTESIVKFGFILPNNWGLADPADVVALAVEAEERGIDSVWVNHHVLNIGYIADRLDDRPYYDALTTLSFVAARTENITLGTSVLVLPYLHPMNLAKELATIDRLSDGRLIAGLGVGGLPEENAALGVLYDERGPWSDEAIEVMRELWSEGPANYDGVHFEMDGLVAAPKPAGGEVRTWIGGGGAAARRRAARYGSGWHPLATLENFAPRVPKMIDALAAEGRTANGFTIAPRVEVQDLDNQAAIEKWAEAGADELIVNVGTADVGELRAGLAHVSGLADH
jgi:probable F420-dependent oxidoreductase